MNKVFFRSLLAATLAVMLFSMGVSLIVLNYYFVSIEARQLSQQTMLIGQGLMNGGMDYLKDMKDDYRVTWIAPDGSVLYDNTADSSLMDNHSQREEVMEAFAYGQGASERYSDTISEKTVYEALRLEDGSVIRVSFTVASIFQLTKGILPYILMVAVLAFLLSALLSKWLSKRIIEPLNNLDLDKPLENDAYEELSPLLIRIEEQKKQIASQIETLRHKNQEFSAITDNMNEGLILLNNESNIISINSAARKLFLCDDRAIGHNLLTIERSLEVQKLIEDAKEKGHSEISFTRNGRVYQVIASKIVEDKEMIGLCLLTVDETEKAQSETIRKEFSANVSHELKTPLHSILGSAELLENNLVKKDDIPLFLARIHKETEHLITLVDDIIQISQLDETASFPMEEVSIKELASSVMDTLQSESSKKGVIISSDIEDIKLLGVKRLLYEVIYNLTDNAIRYNKTGGSVKISFSKQASSLDLKVEDSGIGIPAEHLSRVFERFYRVDKSHSRETGGTGLGLSIVKHAALYHHADVDIKSEVGSGTAITVHFPLTMML